MSAPLLVVEDLDVVFPSGSGATHAVRHASFTLGRERLGIVGESGSGKTTTGRALLGLIPPPGIVTARTMSFAGEDLLRCTERDWQRLRGRRMSMVIFPEPGQDRGQADRRDLPPAPQNQPQGCRAADSRHA